MQGGSGLARLKGIRRVRQDGKVYRYHRATGIRLPDGIHETDREFIAAWFEAEKTTGSPKKSKKAKNGSLAFLWQSYAHLSDYKDLSGGYRNILRRHCDALVARGGDVPIEQIKASHIQIDLKPLNPHPSRQRLKAWRALFSFAVRNGMINESPAAAVSQKKTPKAQKHKKWETRHIDAFRNHWPLGTNQRLGFELLLFVGCRVSDLIRLGPNMLTHDGWLKFNQQKTGGAVAIPLFRTAPQFADIEAQQNAQTAIDLVKTKHLIWLTTKNGAARSPKSVSHWFSAACRDAGLVGDNRRTAHGLRVTCATRLAENYLTPHQIMAWTGHVSLSEVQGYTREVSRMHLLDGGALEVKNVQVSKS